MRRLLEGLCDSLGRAGHGDGPGLSAGGPRVSDDPGDRQLLGTLELEDEPGDRLVAERVVGRSRIDEIRVVDNDARQPGRAHRGPEGLGFRGGDRGRVPAVDVAGEDLKAVAAGLDGPVDRLGEAPGNRLVGPEEPRGEAGRQGSRRESRSGRGGLAGHE